MQTSEIYIFLLEKFQSRRIVSLILNFSGNGYFYRFMNINDITYAPKKLLSEIIKTNSGDLFKIWKEKGNITVHFRDVRDTENLMFWYPSFKNEYISYWLKTENYMNLKLCFRDLKKFIGETNLDKYQIIVGGRLYSPRTVRFLTKIGILSGKSVNMIALFHGRPEYVDYEANIFEGYPAGITCDLNIFGDCPAGVVQRYLNKFLSN